MDPFGFLLTSRLNPGWLGDILLTFETYLYNYNVTKTWIKRRSVAHTSSPGHFGAYDDFCVHNGKKYKGSKIRSVDHEVNENNMELTGEHLNTLGSAVGKRRPGDNRTKAAADIGQPCVRRRGEMTDLSRTFHVDRARLGKPLAI